MVEYTDQQYRDILMYRAFNFTYDEIAARINEKHGLDVSGSSIGRVVREMEDQAREGNPEDVFLWATAHGWLDDTLGLGR